MTEDCKIDQTEIQDTTNPYKARLLTKLIALISRKFVLTNTGLITITSLLYSQKIDQNIFQVLFLATVGAYLTANVIASVTGVE
jgi:hypothetical protein